MWFWSLQFKTNGIQIKTVHVEPARLDIEIEPVFLNNFYNLPKFLILYNHSFEDLFELITVHLVFVSDIICTKYTQNNIIV